MTASIADTTSGPSEAQTYPFDARGVAKRFRHAAIFGALESLIPGGALIISATHDPVPLLTQLEARHGDAFAAEYRQRGPERWRILIRRTA